MRKIAEKLASMDFCLCSVFLLDSQFLVDDSKFVMAVLTSLSSLMMLALPHVTVLTKVDLISKNDRDKLEKLEFFRFNRFLEPDLWPWLNCGKSRDYKGLTSSLASVVDDYGMIQFIMLDSTDETSTMNVATTIDMVLQYNPEHKEMVALRFLFKKNISSLWSLDVSVPSYFCTSEYKAFYDSRHKSSQLNQDLTLIKKGLTLANKFMQIRKL
ncbi:GPN-loop GTPase 3-like [Octopus sinensis]|uniref:GPN-loop GTPase 3 n=1 Tax=Octopus sinensis TaxID=2607531 RepID=A0A6P7U537_9MOLL|nr:GPN-loop GTPase 3-like [Octopus sinensis]